MIDRKDFIIIVLVGFILAVTLYPRITASVGEYDPWLDYNDDGRINIRDIALTARTFGTSGDPTKNVTVTNLPQTWNMNMVSHSLDLTICYDLLIPSGHTNVWTIDTEGYRQLTIGFIASPAQARVRIDFIIGGVTVPKGSVTTTEYIWEFTEICSCDKNRSH